MSRKADNEIEAVISEMKRGPIKKKVEGTLAQRRATSMQALIWSWLLSNESPLHLLFEGTEPRLISGITGPRFCVMLRVGNFKLGGGHEGRSSRLAVHGRRSGKDGYHVVAGGLTRRESRPTEQPQGMSNRRVFPRAC